MLDLWQRLGLMVVRSRSRQKRLRLALDRLHADHDHVIGHWPDDFGDADDVRRPVHRDPESAPRRSRSRSPESVGFVGLAGPWTFQGSRGTGRSWVTPGPDSEQIVVDLAGHSSTGITLRWP